MPKISIIIPVYNVEQYLRQCLDSIVNQTYNNLEIICVNDGSKDNSIDILNEYKQKDSRIKIIDKQNEGVSVARNTGLLYASSDYVMFVDADDWLELNACEELVKYLEKNASDILIFSSWDCMADKKCPNYRVKKIEDIVYYNTEIDFAIFNMICFNKIYRLDFIKNTGVLFPPGLTSAEDHIFCNLLQFNNPICNFIPMTLYYHRRDNNTSLTKTCNIVATDLIAYKILSSNELYKKQDKKYQLQILHRFLIAANWRKNMYAGQKGEIQIDKDICEFLKYSETLFSKEDLKTLKYYNNLKNLKIKNFIKKVFSITNEKKAKKKYKVIRILGIKIKFRQK